MRCLEAPASVGAFLLPYKSVNCRKLRSMSKELDSLIESANKVPHIQTCKELVWFTGDETKGIKPEGRIYKSAFIWEEVCHIYETRTDWHENSATGVMFLNGHTIVTDFDFNTLLNIWRLWKQQQA